MLLSETLSDFPLSNVSYRNVVLNFPEDHGQVNSFLKTKKKAPKSAVAKAPRSHCR